MFNKFCTEIRTVDQVPTNSDITYNQGCTFCHNVNQKFINSIEKYMNRDNH